MSKENHETYAGRPRSSRHVSRAVGTADHRPLRVFDASLGNKTGKTGKTDRVKARKALPLEKRRAARRAHQAALREANHQARDERRLQRRAASPAPKAAPKPAKKGKA